MRRWKPDGHCPYGSITTLGRCANRHCFATGNGYGLSAASALEGPCACAAFPLYHHRTGPRPTHQCHARSVAAARADRILPRHSPIPPSLAHRAIYRLGIGPLRAQQPYAPQHCAHPTCFVSNLRWDNWSVGNSPIRLATTAQRATPPHTAARLFKAAHGDSRRRTSGLLKEHPAGLCHAFPTCRRSRSIRSAQRPVERMPTGTQFLPGYVRIANSNLYDPAPAGPATLLCQLAGGCI